jgi:hypothetical protein
MEKSKGEHDSQLSRSGLLGCGCVCDDPSEPEVLCKQELCAKLDCLCVGWDIEVHYNSIPKEEKELEERKWRRY